MEFRILTATPGMNKSRIAEKIADFVRNLQIDGRQSIVGVSCVEDHVGELCPKDFYFPDQKRDPLALIMAELPQDKIRSLWRKAFKKSVKEATSAIDGKVPDLAIVVTSLYYYRSATYEFYCPGDPRLFSQMQQKGRFPRMAAF